MARKRRAGKNDQSGRTGGKSVNRAARRTVGGVRKARKKTVRKAPGRKAHPRTVRAATATRPPSRRPDRLLRVALTGGIATGKSFVLAQFRKRGLPCLDADMLARGVIAPGTEATQAIAARFGAQVLKDDGSVDRPALASIVFSDDDARRDLEAIVHPAVYRAIDAGLRAFGRIGHYDIGVVDIPLLYESGHDREFDRVIVTACPEGLQLARLIERGLTEQDAKKRIAAQWPTREKAARADFVVNTARTPRDTERQVEEILRTLRAGRE